jgi:DNA-binding MarR family transcriptional regulator
VPRRPPTRFGARERSPGFLLWRATLAWQRRIRTALDPYGLTHVQFVLLASLWWLEEHDPDPPTQSRLAAYAGIDQMMTSQVLRKLEAQKLLDRPADTKDARARRLRLTPGGRQHVARALAAVQRADTDYFAPLGDRHEAFLEALAALTIDTVDDTGTSAPGVER